MKNNYQTKFVIFNLLFIAFVLIAFIAMKYLESGILRLALAVILVISGIIIVIVNVLHLVAEYK
ncbi:hypothetical protein MmiHf6_09000 [Methanimicrococcus hongohii]|uniref:Uncharacterized protein n=1 Tax=Methanimicrococcus hongohii TaxID=3028295 RepID=A0AA96UZL2_9EURY|nr:hypothetical protein MmiHf6_09000 [Methanimicrococcus sp. Hf6]